MRASTTAVSMRRTWRVMGVGLREVHGTRGDGETLYLSGKTMFGLKKFWISSFFSTFQVFGFSGSGFNWLGFGVMSDIYTPTPDDMDINVRRDEEREGKRREEKGNKGGGR
jgi:hypothetical protein